MAEAITVHCASCNTAFPVDPDKVPRGGVSARCSACGSVFRVEAPTTQPEVGAASESPPGGDESGPLAENAGSTAGPALDRPPAAGEEETGQEDGAAATPDLPEQTPGAETPGEVSPGDVSAEPGPPLGKEQRTADPADAPAPSFGEGEEDADLEVEEPLETAGGPSAGTGAAFGQRSPEEKAQRLARVLVSDMITYNPELYENALQRGTLEEDFEEEIEKSWEEYVEQVGEDLATSTPYWRNALNEILAKGEDLF